MQNPSYSFRIRAPFANGDLNAECTKFYRKGRGDVYGI